MKICTPTIRSAAARLLRRSAILVICLLMAAPAGAGSTRASGAFPLYPVIADNIAFWKDVYTRYSKHQAVIHDKNDLSVIYEVVTTVDKNLPGADKANTLLLERKKQHYRNMLTRLSRSAAATAEERRVAGMFSGKNSARRMAAAAEAIRIQTGMRERFREGVIRSGAYIPAIKEIFRSHGLPEDLAYLPHVESSFDTSAFSKVGASGIWQFTKNTGKSYLRIDRAVDERSDPLIAAHAAARYLKNSHAQLGTWPLALTSYNYGTAGMKRALNEKGSYERIFSEYDKGHFKFASRNFYSEFLAALASAKEIESDPSIRLARPEPTRSVTLKKSAGISHVKKHFGVSAGTIERLNPALRPEVFSGARNIPAGYALRLPAAHQAEQPTIAARDSKKPPPDATGTVHQVRPGENLTRIAARYGVSPQALARANGLDGSVIHSGQKLNIPAAGTAAISPGGSAAAGKKVSRLAVYTTTVHNGKRYGKIRVQPGESLHLLAKWTATPPVVLQRLNKLENAARIQPGKQLVLVFDKVSIDFFHKKRQQFHTRDQKDSRTTG